ncbi:ORF98 [Leucania separata nucleopolyhedrovirus]|uniref:ORF98 n=1 Tax=Leucania separata nucleopolyhedrovirus TaxID=1307956 RepID=Q0IL21_NPVLS|nr:ORF98 [Leucania separata nucleopolyhedrovirus]AAR28862.1 ORF98 [Leucania separata nucleopolyhedrovirus]
MIPLTPLFARYRDSFFLYAFWMVHLMYNAPTKEFAELLSTEFTYLYHLACIITYKDKQEHEIEELKNWLLSLPKTYKYEQIRLMTAEKMESLNLRALQPKDYTFKFSTIWDTIHFLCMVIDDMVENRAKIGIDVVQYQLVHLKPIFYNLFFRLTCSVCRNHYLTIKGDLVFYIERIELALEREKTLDQKIVMVDFITPDTVNENTLMRHGMLYKSMVFHNQVNDYRFIQRKIKNPMNYERKDWTTYKKQLGLK